MTLFATATDIVPDIPDRFWKIPYDVAHDRDSPTLMGIETGANCQNFAYDCCGTLAGQYPFYDQAIYGTIPSTRSSLIHISRLISCSSTAPTMRGERMLQSTLATIEQSI
jgi:hypothetical protein